MENERMIRWSEIEPLCVLRLLLRKLWLVLLAALTGVMGASLILSFLVSYTYTSSATFTVTSRSGAAAYYTNVNVATEVAAIYSELLQSSVMNDTVAEQLDAGVSGSITAEQLGSTNLIRVTATAGTPKNALLIMNAVIDCYPELSDYVSSTAVLSVLNAPTLSITPVKEYNATRICAACGLLCALVMAALLVWLSVSSETIQNPEGAKARLDARVLATLPHEKAAGGRRGSRKKVAPSRRAGLLISSPAVSFSFTESIHQIATVFEREKAGGRSVFLFTSVSESEGKSTVAANTALSLAAKNGRVLFIDLDLRRPVQNRILGLDVPEKQEFGQLLSAGVPAGAVLDAAVRDPKTNLNCLLSSRSCVEILELLSAPLLAQVIREARLRFDYIVIDSPPLGYFTDSEILSDLADASVLVVRQDTVPAPDINDAVDSLRAGKAEFLGCVLNDMRCLSSAGLSGSYGYGYGYGYGKYGKYGKYGRYGKYGKYSYGSDTPQK